MKRIILFLSIIFTIQANNDDLDLKISQEVRFNDGFGSIIAYPQNITEELRNKLKFIGEYNLEKNTGNVTIKFKRIQFDGRIYELTEPYEKKLRLKSPQTARFNDGAKIQVSGGNREEILQIVNKQKAEVKAQNNNNLQNELKRGDENTQALSNLGRSLSTGTGTSSYSPYYTPYYTTSSTDSTTSSTGDYSSSTTNSDGSCKAPQIIDGIVNIYATSSTGGACKHYTAPANSIYYKYGQATCQNKIDYEAKVINVGREGYVSLEDNKEYKITSCEYLPTQELKSDLSQCLAIPNYTNKTATIQNQYYYMLENQRVNVGGCSPTKEIVPLEEDLNKCGYRHDFVRKLSIKQRQFFYMQGNTRQDVGECVDKDEEGFRFSHYEDNNTCSYDVIDDRVFYQSRLAFTDLTGGTSYATDCRVISAGGLQIFEELSGYQFNDLSKQAQRKVNQYFFIPNTQTKKYVSKDVLTNKTYPYQETLCKWEHHDDEKYSTRYSKIFFQDTDESKEVVVSECSNTINTQNIAYIFLGDERSIEETLTGKTLIPEQQSNGLSWKIYNTNDYIKNTPNAVLNTNITKTLGSITSVSSQYSEEQKAGLDFINRDESYSYSCNKENGQGMQIPSTCYKTTEYTEVKTKNNYGTNQIVEKQVVKQTYRRGDGSKFYPQAIIEWRAK